MNIQASEIFHPRIIAASLRLFEDGEYQNAARESMRQVEIALREKGLVPKDRSGTSLATWVFENGEQVRLSPPPEDDLLEQARTLFKGAFSYYQNLAARDGNADGKAAFRVMVFASELLDLIAASQRSLESVGGIEGVIQAGIFRDAREFWEYLEFHIHQQIFEGNRGEYDMDFQMKGFRAAQKAALADFNLLRYKEIKTIVNEESGSLETTLVGIFELTSEGEKVLSELEQMLNDGNQTGGNA